MDWTGGTRRRFAAKKNNAVVQRQKAYFARARAALNAPNSQVAFPTVTKRSRTTSTYRSSNLRPVSRSHSDHSERHHSKRKGSETRPKTMDKVPSHPRTHGNDSPTVTQVHSSGRNGATSADNHAVVTKYGNMQHQNFGSTGKMTEEERLLLANRRRLLDRSDWLSLVPAQPLTMSFPSSHDRDRIGKRRKVETPRPRRDDSAGPRMITPLFEERIRPIDYVMSGALPADEFNIKIGTDALATQTQASNRSCTPANTSMRPPSTEMEALSEESMLLDADDGHFDPLPVSDADRVPAEPMHFQTQYVCDVPNMKRFEYADDSRSLLVNQSQQQNDIMPYNAAHHPDAYDGDVYELDPEGNLVREVHESFSQDSIETVSIHKYSEEPASLDQTEMHRHDQLIVQETDEDDDMWRTLMNVVQHNSSNPSTKAVKSSSLHLTRSESDVRPMPAHDNLAATTQPQRKLSWEVTDLPNSAKTPNEQTQGAIETSTSLYLEKLPSPSASLMRITNPANHRAQTTTGVDEEDEENALWREFVCWNEDDSDETSQVLYADQNSNRIPPDVPSLMPASSSYMVSDLGTSNKTTIGGDTLALDESVAENEIDEIIDDESVADQIPPSKNIHTTRTLNPKRFLPPSKRQRAPPRRSSSFLPENQMHTKAPNVERSVYDLVDSDGYSLA